MALDQLSDESCIAVLAGVGAKYVDNAGYDSKTLAKTVLLMLQAEVPHPPAWLTNPGTSIETMGPIARRALNEMLESDNERLRQLIRAGIAEHQVKQAQIVDLTIVAVGGGILLGLAVLSKIKYSKDKGWELEPGFPQLAEVLDKAGKLVDKVVGGSD